MQSTRRIARWIARGCSGLRRKGFCIYGCLPPSAFGKGTNCYSTYFTNYLRRTHSCEEGSRGNPGKLRPDAVNGVGMRKDGRGEVPETKSGPEWQSKKQMGPKRPIYFYDIVCISVLMFLLCALCRALHRAESAGTDKRETDRSIDR